MPQLKQFVSPHVTRTPRHPLTILLASSIVMMTLILTPGAAQAEDELTSGEFEMIRQAEQARVATIQKVYGSVVAIYGNDRGGGGSGVIFDPSGLALTNHHVIQGAGTEGWGGLADGKLYRWHLIGTDPGGDVAIIKLTGKDSFPYAVLADSDTVRIGDFALAMGNPFILAEDQTPTVTLGIVSGVKRYQYGSGNELVYGNCIQTDSSINPGNSGGPLFNMRAEVIGINGRGSFEERGRVNVGLGYAISSNQIRNFIPDLLATKVVEHGTLDARFADRSGGVLCETLNLDSPVAKLGLSLGDRLLAFEGVPITSANQFTNLICTLPEEWPVELSFENSDGETKTVWVRLLGLPYTPPQAPPMQPMPGAPGEGETPEQEEGEQDEGNEDAGDGDGGEGEEGEDGEDGEDGADGEDGGETPEPPTPAQRRAMEQQRKMFELLSSPAGTILNDELNQENVGRLAEAWVARSWSGREFNSQALRVTEEIVRAGEVIGYQQITLTDQGQFHLQYSSEDSRGEYLFDGEQVWEIDDERREVVRATAAAADPYLAQVLPIAAFAQTQRLGYYGELWLDGSDKAQRHTAYRLKTLDQNGNWFYVWLSMAPGYDREELELLKASIDKDSDEGAVTFHEWKQVAGLRWPHQRDFVEGLSERVIQSIRTLEVELAGDAGALFEAISEPE